MNAPRPLLSLPSPLRLLVALIVLITGVATGTGVAEAQNGVAAITPESSGAVAVTADVPAGHVGSDAGMFDDWSSGCCVAPSSAPGRGGVGPVRQGEAGVQRTVDDLEAAGGRVLGREVTVEAGGVRTRPDLFVELPCGTQCFLEVKTGPGAALTTSQATGFPVIRSGGAVPRGGNAAAAGLTPGVPMGPTPVWTVHQPWPL